MPPDYHFGYYFFAPRGRFEACGMFTASHIISSVLFLCVTIFALWICRKKFHNETKNTLYKCSAIILTFLEAIKISHSFIYGDYYLDAWFPLSYCGLLIFALWMAGFCKGKAKRSAELFIAFGCPIAGLAFLISPSTSLMMFPVWHYFSLYSLFFHSFMIFLGTTALRDEKRITKKSFALYNLFVLSFCIMGVILNAYFDSNLMLLSNPYNIPFKSIENLYNHFPFVYTLFVIFCYSNIPIITAFITGNFRK